MSHRARTNVFSAVQIDRLAERRKDAGWLSRALRSADARFVPVWGRRSLLSEAGTAVLLTREQLPEAPEDTAQAILIGAMEGCICFAVDLGDSEEPPTPADTRFRTLRSIGSLASHAEAALLAHAQAMTFWLRAHRFCGRCGTPNRIEQAGHVLVCGNVDCGRTQFPRSDPAIIVLVSDGERALLGRQPGWPEGVYSTIAGFVEPGESLEHAVAREVAEETGVRVGAVRYHSSQPWPFPSSLMLGFQADAVSTDIVLGDDELEDARWFSRGDIVAGLRAGRFRIPSTISIAFRLVERWFDAGDEGRLGALLRRE